MNYELSKIQENSNIQFLTFFIEQNMFGVNIHDIKEVNPDCQITHVFHAPEEIKGFVNLRGQIYLIIDLRKTLGLQVKQGDSKGNIILIKDHIAGQTGIIVDEIGDVISVDSDLIELSVSGNKEEAELMFSKNIVTGICKLKSQLMNILDVYNLLDILKIDNKWS